MPAPKPHPVRGYLAIATAALLWGTAATLGKLAFSGRIFAGAPMAIDPVILSQTRTTFSLMALLPVLLLRGGRSAVSLPRRDLLLSLALGIGGITGSNYFYYLAIDKSTVATAIILQYTAPIWVLLYMLARHYQRPTLQRIFAVAAAVAGSALAIGFGSDEQFRADPYGVAAALVAAVCFAVYNVLGHRLVERHSRWKVMLYALVGAAGFWLLVNPPWKALAAGYSSEQWTFLVIFALASWLLPFSFYFLGLQYLDATRAIVTSCLEPVFAIVLAHLFVHESLTAMQLLGMVVVVVATVVIQLPEKRAAAEPFVAAD